MSMAAADLEFDFHKINQWIQNLSFNCGDPPYFSDLK